MLGRCKIYFKDADIYCKLALLALVKSLPKIAIEINTRRIFLHLTYLATEDLREKSLEMNTSLSEATEIEPAISNLNLKKKKGTKLKAMLRSLYEVGKQNAEQLLNKIVVYSSSKVNWC